MSYERYIVITKLAPERNQPQKYIAQYSSYSAIEFTPYNAVLKLMARIKEEYQNQEDINSIMSGWDE
jgi:hypothetical protein